MNWLIFIASVLACYRLSHMLSREEGPAAIFSKMRRKVPARTNSGRGIRCPFCWSIHNAAWITAFLWWAECIEGRWTPFYVFALSGGAVLLHKLDG